MSEITGDRKPVLCLIFARLSPVFFSSTRVTFKRRKLDRCRMLQKTGFTRVALIGVSVFRAQLHSSFETASAEIQLCRLSFSVAGIVFEFESKKINEAHRVVSVV